MAFGWPRTSSRKARIASKARRSEKKSTRKSKDDLQFEPLEERQLLAVTLNSLAPNEGALYRTDSTLFTRNVAPRELTFTFSQDISGSTLGGITIVRAGTDDTIGNANDVAVTNFHIGNGLHANQVVVRFAENLVDDRYQIRIAGGASASALRSVSGDALAADLNINVNLDLGVQVTGIVPQPITRDVVTNALSQADNKIDVYFSNFQELNDDAPGTNPDSVLNPAHYQLFSTKSTSTPRDDGTASDGAAILPTSVSYTYNPISGLSKATLTFASPLQSLLGGAVGSGNFRLRIGNDQTPYPAPTILNPGDPLGTFSGSQNLGQLSTTSIVVNQDIDAPDHPLEMPGGIYEPGHRDIPHEEHVDQLAEDVDPGISVRNFSFPDYYGVDPLGNPLTNQITEAQKQRVREALELYSYYLGVQFVETTNSGFIFAVGDMRALDPTTPNQPNDGDFHDAGNNSAPGLVGRPTVVVDLTEDYGNSEFGGLFFRVVMDGAGALLGLGNTYDLPPLTIKGDEDQLSVGAPEPVFPGDHDIVHGQHLYRPESSDIDMYRFEVTARGRVNAQIDAERNSSLLDSVLTLYRELSILNIASNGAASFVDGDSFTINDGITTKTFEFDSGPIITTTSGSGVADGATFIVNGRTFQLDKDNSLTNPAHTRVAITASDSAAQVALKIAAAINANVAGVTAFAGGGRVSITNASAVTTSGAGISAAGAAGVAAGNVAIAFDANDSVAEMAQKIASAINGVSGIAFITPGALDIEAKVTNNRVELRGRITSLTFSLAATSALTRSIDRELYARNDNYYGDDSFIGLDLRPGTYYVAVTSTGNTDFDPTVSGTGFGGRTEGAYQLRLEFQPTPVVNNVDAVVNGTTIRNIRDNTGAAIDGDLDGRPGGAHNFWFDVGPTIYVDKTADPDVADGTLANPFTTISEAVLKAANRIVAPAAGGAVINDGDTFIINDGFFGDVVFEFDLTGSGGTNFPNVFPLHVLIPFTAADTAATIRTSMLAAINAERTAGHLQILAPTTVGSHIIDLRHATNPNQLNVNLADTPGLLTSGKLIRVVANGGDDDNVATIGDNVDTPAVNEANRPYLIGKDIFGDALPDGETLEVPQGTTLVIDPGVIFKMLGSTVDVGTSAANIDRRGAAIQVLGTPEHKVYFTSLLDTTIGFDTLGLGTTPFKGDWSGIIFRGDSDSEQFGVFRNYVNMADLQWGGGQTLIDSVTQVVNPLHLVEARPNLTFNRISNSADAAISADPNSFEESRFYGNNLVAPFQPFTNDYDRVGPEIYGNTLIGNTLNALFIRIRTQAGQSLDTLDLPARWDDTDIVHVVSENLVINGAPGGLAGRSLGRLAIDPNIIVKLDGSRIETTIGGQFIAEGLPNNAVIFTSLFDDRYGVGGTLDTNGDDSLGAGERVAAPGDWAGLFFGHASYASLDNVLVTLGGGRAEIEGGFDNFNAIEIHQATARITNSFFVMNAGGQAATTRNNRGGNSASTIFVRGAQPIIVGNVIHSNGAAAIHVNVNSLNWRSNIDLGRSTGTADVYWMFNDNVGPLVRMNRLQNNPINGMVVRGQTLTTQSVWDDTDIVHVVLSEIAISNHHTYSGLLLKSSANESLVVKLLGANAGFTAGGWPLEISDRIGGSVWIIGTPLRPVILTSLNDDTVGAGLDFDGIPQNDTNNNAGLTTAAPGDWRSVKIDKLSNDRNVRMVVEEESTYTGGVEANGTTATAQLLGTLATGEKASDDVLRLGFEVRGTISHDAPQDVDIYSFKAKAGTEAWLDLDLTRYALDAVLELVDANGVVRARSDNSPNTSAFPELLPGNGTSNLLIARGMKRDDFDANFDAEDVVWNDGSQREDLYTWNPKDAGMRVVLPGTAGQEFTYFVRVRSRGASLNDLTGGQTHGEYRLQVRLRPEDEVPGSTIRGADIRFATNGVEILGQPTHSPLLGESFEIRADHQTLAQAQFLGNLLTTDRNALAVGGRVDAAGDIDWYSFELSYESIERFTDQDRTWSTILDIDYADGTGRPDLVLSLYDENGNLIYTSFDSNVAEDQPGPPSGPTTDDLDRGTFGKLDPYIGPAQLPASMPQVPPRRYFVAVSNDARVPAQLDQYFLAAATNTVLRLEPSTGTRRIFEDHVHVTTGDGNVTLTNPVSSTGQTPGAYAFGSTDDRTRDRVNSHATSYHLGDAQLFVTSNSANRHLYIVDPFTGAVEVQVSGNDAFDGTNGNAGYGDVAFRNDGRLFSFTLAQDNGTNSGNTGNFTEFDTGTGDDVVGGDDGVGFEPAITPNQQGPQYQAIDFYQPNAQNPQQGRRVYAVAPVLFSPIDEDFNPLGGSGLNAIWQFDPDTGAAVNDQVNANAPPTEPLPQAILSTGEATVSFDVQANGTAATLNDGDTFIVDDGNVLPTTFEMNRGLSIDFTGGAAAITDLSTITVTDNGGAVTQIFRFNKNPLVNPPVAGTQDIILGGAETAAQVASLFSSAVNSLGNTLTNLYTYIVNAAGTEVWFADLAAPANHAVAIGAGVSATQIGANGVTAPNVAVNYQPVFARSAKDTPTGIEGVSTPASFIAFNIANAINGSALGAFMVATTNGATVVIADTDPPFGDVTVTLNAGIPFGNVVTQAGGGGKITGITFVDDTVAASREMAAVTITGQFLLYDMPRILGQGFETLADTPLDPSLNVDMRTAFPGITRAAFTSLTEAPQNVDEDGDGVSDYEDVFIATGFDDLNNNQTFDGNERSFIFAIDRAGTARHILLDGRAATPIIFGTGVGGTVGSQVTFGTTGGSISPFDYNPWHVTDTRRGDAGHGTNVAPDDSRNTLTANQAEGRTSFYFGFEDPRNRPILRTDQGVTSTNLTGEVQPGSRGYTSNTGLYGTYNAPGGTYGSLETNTFSLEGYTSGDQPAMYFNYFLNTQDGSSDFNRSDMRDSFRVYISDDGVNWQQLTTNNSIRGSSAGNQGSGAGQNQPIPSELPVEWTYNGGLYRGDRALQKVQETFDSADPANDTWRQARIDLGDFAGMKNLKIRFDFSTSGDMNVGDVWTTGSYLGARPADELLDGQTFQVRDQNTAGAPTVTFEFNQGFNLRVPGSAGQVIADTNTFTVNGTTFEFDKSSNGVSGGNVEIDIFATDSTAVVRDKMAAAIQSALGIAVHVKNDRIFFFRATATSVSSATSGLVASGGNGVSGANAAILIDPDMTAEEVARQIAIAMDARFTKAGNVDDPNVFTSVKLDGSVIRLIGRDFGNVVSAPGTPYNGVSSSTGATGDTRQFLTTPDQFGRTYTAGTARLAAVSFLQGDQFGNFSANKDFGQEGGGVGNGRSQNNLFEGVYIDDIMLGFAERGEMVTGANGDTSFASVATFYPTASPTLRNLSENTGFPDGTAKNLLAEYQLEIRRGSEYGGNTSRVNPNVDLSVAFDSNDRHLDGFSAIAPAGSLIGDGDSFLVSDGATIVRFEFDRNGSVIPITGLPPTVAISLTGTETPFQLADKIAQAINAHATLNVNTFSIEGRLDFAGAADVTFERVVDPTTLIVQSLGTPGFRTIVASRGSDIAEGDSFVVSDLFGNRAEFFLSRDDSMLARSATQLAQFIANLVDFDPRLSGVTATVAANSDRITFTGVSEVDTFHTTALRGGFKRWDKYFIPTDQGDYLVTPQGDDNRFRDQGQILIEQSTIRNSLQFGILVDAATRDADGSQAHPGSVRVTRELNTDRLAPGVTIQNNLIMRGGQGGIHFSGDPNTGTDPLAAVPFGRIVNNTIYGSETATGIGIRVSENAGPTLLNNIVSNFTTGISVDGTSALPQVNGDPRTIVGGNLYKNNVSNLTGVGQSFAINLTPTDPLFVDAANNNFNLAALSQAIDSSINTVQERTNLVNVTNPLGIAPSPILAPDRDLFNLVRVDDPLVATPPGLGAQVLKDRGAIERTNQATLTIDDVSVIEGAAGTTTNLVFTVTLSRVLGQAVQVSYGSSPDTATAGVDYTSVAGVLTFNPGETTKQILVPVLGDDITELNERVLLNLFNPINAPITKFTGIGTIVDDDGPTVSIDSVTVTEGTNPTATLTVTLSADPGIPVSVDFITVDGSAVAPGDYSTVSGQLTFLPGQLSQTIIVPIIDDNVVEGTENFTVVLSNGQGAIALPGGGVVTILDDEPTITINDVVVTEGNGGTTNATFTVSLSKAATGVVVVDYSTADGTATDADNDYEPTSGQLTFAAGETQKTITVQVNGDALEEPDETFFVNLSISSGAAFASLSDAQGQATITNDDQPTLSINDVALIEGNSGTKQFVFTVSLLQPAVNAISVNFTTVNGTATAGSDYQSTVGTLNFAAGETAKVISVPVSGDTTFELNETFFVDLSAAVNANLGKARGVGTIIDDDINDTVVVGPEAGLAPLVRVLDGHTGVEKFSFMAYGATFTGGVRVATGDVTGDGVPDIITAPGPGGGPHIRVFDGTNGAPLGDIFPPQINMGYRQGLYVASGDVDGDGRWDIIVGTDFGAGEAARVLAFSGMGFGTIFDSQPISPTSAFHAGARVAAGDITGDGRTEIIVGTGQTFTSRVLVFNPATNTVVRDFQPYGNFTGGVYVAAGDVNGDGRADIITGAGAGGGPHVQVFSGLNNALIASFFATGTPTSGVRVGAVDFNKDGFTDILTGTGVGTASQFQIFNGRNGGTAILAQQPAYGSFSGGVYVGGSGRTFNPPLTNVGGSTAGGTPTQLDSNTLIVAPGRGDTPLVRVIDAETGLQRFAFLPYGNTFYGGIHVATGDINGDGTDDIITAPGAGGGPLVHVFDGLTGNPIRSIFAYGAGFTGGVWVASGDVDGDGKDDIITGPGAGGGPHVKVFSGATGAVIREAFPYPIGFTGGVQVASGDVDGDGKDDIITGAGPGGGPHVKVISGATGGTLGEFFPFPIGFLGGVFVASGDVNGDGKDDIIVGAGAGGGPHVKVLGNANGTVVLGEAFPYAMNFAGGVRVSSNDFNNDGKADVVVAPGAGGNGNIKVLSGANMGFALSSLVPVPTSAGSGLFVAGASAVGSPLLAAAGEVQPVAGVVELTRAELDPIVERAMSSWLALHPSVKEFLGQVEVKIGDLRGARLGWASGSTIVIDRDAAGHGWFVDATPYDNAEFQTAAFDGLYADGGAEAARGIDLLTVVAHELGHLLGLGDLPTGDDDVMTESLAAGVRRLPDEDAIDALFGGN